jgi:hypothetical protein
LPEKYFAERRTIGKPPFGMFVPYSRLEKIEAI